jgi:hypothetical protein
MQKQLSAQLRTNFLILLITAKIPEKYPSNLLRNKAIRFVPASCSVVHRATIRIDKAPLRPRSSHGTGCLRPTQSRHGYTQSACNPVLLLRYELRLDPQALESVTTPLVFMLDVDLIPDPGTWHATRQVACHAACCMPRSTLHVVCATSA